MSATPNDNKAVEILSSKSVFKWKIRNFSATISSMETEDSMESDEFITIGVDGVEYRWKMELYPKGDEEECKNYLSFYLNSEEKFEIVEKLSARCALMILKSDNGVGEYTEPYTVTTFSRINRGHGDDRFVLRQEAEKYMKDDSLTVACMIDSCRKSTDTHIVEQFIEPYISLKLEELAKFETLVDNSQHSDVTFIVDGKRLHAHKAILSSRCSVFAGMFDHDMKENKENEVHITDIKYEILKEMFRYIYSGEVKKIKTIADQLIFAADKYSLLGLKSMCEVALGAEVSTKNVLDYFRIADLCNASKLKKEAKRYLANNSDEIVQDPEFNSLLKLQESSIIEIICVLVSKD